MDKQFDFELNGQTYQWGGDGWMRNHIQLGSAKQIEVTDAYVARVEANLPELKPYEVVHEASIVKDLARGKNRLLLQKALQWIEGVLRKEPMNQAALAVQSSLMRKLRRSEEADMRTRLSGATDQAPLTSRIAALLDQNLLAEAEALLQKARKQGFSPQLEAVEARLARLQGS